MKNTILLASNYDLKPNTSNVKKMKNSSWCETVLEPILDALLASSRFGSLHEENCGDACNQTRTPQLEHLQNTKDQQIQNASLTRGR